MPDAHNLLILNQAQSLLGDVVLQAFLLVELGEGRSDILDEELPVAQLLVCIGK